MAILGEIGKKISVTSQNVVHKAKGMADITGLKGQIYDEHNKIDKYYQNLGKMYYEYRKNEPIPELRELVIMISNSYSRIEEIKAAIKAIESSKTCPSCGATIDDTMSFCSGCGAKIEQEESQEQEETENIKYCIQCGHRIPEDSVFCTKCGTQQIK